MKLYYSLISVLFFSYAVSADDDFSSLLNEVSGIATKTKLNIDYQPSVVSVLHADKLKKLGITNLHEAIGLLPGIETSILHTGWKQVIIRGAHNPDTFVFDKYKLYIDGVDVGSDLYSTSYYYLDFPVELIDRIEVLRGSASTIYGPGAFSGAINVITKSSLTEENDAIFGSVGSYEYAKGGFVKHINTGKWNIGIDSYYQQNNKTINAGSAFVSPFETSYQRSDYNSLENFKDYSIGITAKYDDWKFIARYKAETTDNFYGLGEMLEPVEGGYQRNQSAVAELQHQHKLDSDLTLETKVGVNYYAFVFDTTVYDDYLGSGIMIRMNPTYHQLNTYVDMNLEGENIENHEWMIGIGGQKINTLKNEFGTTYRNPAHGGPAVLSDSLVYLIGEYGFLNGDNDQWIKSVYAQDIYSINDNLDLSANIRLDDYSLFENMLSYRLGCVYRLNESNILKAVYGRSYRAPSYVEAFQAMQEGFKTGNPNLEPELIDTYELAYTYKNQDTIVRTNLFYYIMQDVIDSINNEPLSFIGDYANHKQRNAKGIEFEYTHYFSNGAELMANLSYVTTEYFTPDYYNPVEFQSPEISEVLSKGYLLYPITQTLSLNSAWYYNGPKKGYDRGTGIAKTYDSMMVVDETLAYEINDSSTLTLSAKNLFNEPVIYPSYQGKHDGLRRDGRNWLLTYEKRF
jgi:outer membrane receptor for ferrienterochelin and colicins